MNQDLLAAVTPTGESAFLLACRRNDLTRLKVLVEKLYSAVQTQDINEPEENRRRKMVDILSHHYNKYGKGLLHECAQNSSLECLRFLLDDLKFGADSLKQGDWTPLMLACAAKNDASRAIVRLFIDRGADVRLKNKDGWTAFHIACRTGDIEKIRSILAVDPESWKTRSKNGRTPLHTACMNGCKEVVQFLLTIPNVIIDAADLCGTTALMDAVRAGNLEIIETLVKNKADVNKCDNLGRKLSHLAAICGANECLDLLFNKYCVDIHERTLDESAMVPIHFAAKEGHVSTVEKLINMGADPTVVDNSGRNILHFAAIGQNRECYEHLFNVGLKNCADKFGRHASSYLRKQVP